MKAHMILSYNPDNAYDSERIERIRKANNVYNMLWSFDQEFLRPVAKHEDGPRAEVFEEIRDRFYHYLREFDIDL